MPDNDPTSDESLQNLEDIYQLAPMQQGMLFHSILAPDSGTYFEQTLFTIKGALDLEAFAQAWQSVVDRHTILRTSFQWEGLEKPVQVVHRRVLVPIAQHDWRALPPASRAEQLQSFIDADRRRDFVLSEAPLLRLALFRFTEDEHKFLFSRHHLLIDRWSRALLLKDFFAFYEALAAAKPPDLPAPRPYANYIAWLSRQNAAEADAFWKTSLAGFTAPTRLAVDQPIEFSHGLKQYGDLRVQIPDSVTINLQHFAREHRLTLNTLAQAVWALLISRYSGDEDVLFGVTVAGRPATLPGVESMVGLFINTLPLRVQTPAMTPVRSWLKDLQAQQSAIQEYAYSSLVDINSAAEIPGGAPLFESILVFENLPAGGSYESPNRGLEMLAERGFGSTTGLPLTVIVSPGARLTVQIVYDRARFEAEVIGRLLAQFQTLLENLPNYADQAISRLPLLTTAEHEQIVQRWNDTAVDYHVQSVVSLFEAQAERTPGDTAVEFQNTRLSYRELNARANQLAAYLRGLSLGADDRVGISIDRGLEMAVAVLGVLKAGAAYVPLDPSYPGERLAFMLADAECKVLLSSERLAKTLPQSSASLLCLDSAWDQIANQNSENAKTKIEGRNLAYVIYTSGSTGWPKGVALEHRALANLICWQLAQSFTPARTLQFASLSFDVSFQEMFSTWCSGGTLLLVSDELRRDAEALLHFLESEKVERVFLPFVYLQHLASAFADSTVTLRHLREIITAGEQLEITPQIAAFCDSLPELQLHNHYGPTESHVVTAFTLSGKPPAWPRLPPIGRPIANTQIYILDQHGQPSPIGVAGELCIGGANLARGYLHRPELTAEKFIANPFSSKDPPARIYRTGDAARFTSDGNIEFLGRLDNQIKIRGFRVELGEIEATLALHPSVREAAIAVQDDAGDRRLVGYVVPAAPESRELAAELRRFLKTKLPDYMAPADFVFLEALPLTPSGKINRRALPAVDRRNTETDAFVAPRTDVERRLAEIWSAVLKHERVGVDDNFFELGGHSLLATQLISRVRHAFQIELPLRYLFEFPTIAGLAAGLAEFEKIALTKRPPAITRQAEHDAEDLLARIDELTDEQVEALLGETLG